MLETANKRKTLKLIVVFSLLSLASCNNEGYDWQEWFDRSFEVLFEDGDIKNGKYLGNLTYFVSCKECYDDPNGETINTLKDLYNSAKFRPDIEYGERNDEFFKYLINAWEVKDNQVFVYCQGNSEPYNGLYITPDYHYLAYFIDNQDAHILDYFKTFEVDPDICEKLVEQIQKITPIDYSKENQGYQ